MASLHARLGRIERASREAAEDLGSPEPDRQIALLLLSRHPEMALARPDQADPTTYLRMQIRLAHARGDLAEARRLESLDPDRPMPPPPGTPCAERMRVAREALDRTSERLRDAHTAAAPDAKGENVRGDQFTYRGN